MTQHYQTKKDGEKTIIVFTGKDCKGCHPYKEQLKKLGLKFQEIDISVDQNGGKKLSMKWGVRSLPFMVIAKIENGEEVPIHTFTAHTKPETIKHKFDQLN